jgi:AcrR family transcriptional regulator
VSRGSFYWHFADVAAFQAAILGEWEKRATDDVITLLEHQGGAAVERLLKLTGLVATSRGSLECQIRAWAAQNRLAVAALERVDCKRLSYLKDLIVAVGHSSDQAEARARFLHLTMIGQFTVGRPTATQARQLADMVALLVKSNER